MTNGDWCKLKCNQATREFTFPQTSYNNSCRSASSYQDTICFGSKRYEVNKKTLSDTKPLGDSPKLIEDCSKGCGDYGYCKKETLSQCRDGETIINEEGNCLQECSSGRFSPLPGCGKVTFKGNFSNPEREMVLRTLSRMPNSYIDSLPNGVLTVSRQDSYVLQPNDNPLANFVRQLRGYEQNQVYGGTTTEETSLDNFILNYIKPLQNPLLRPAIKVTTDKIILLPDAGFSETTLLHELSHAMEDQGIEEDANIQAELIKKYGFETQGPSGLEYAYNQAVGCKYDLTQFKYIIDEASPWEYGQTNCAEHFAVSFEHYTAGGQDSCLLKNISPNSYNFIKRYIYGGKEFIPKNGCP